MFVISLIFYGVMLCVILSHYFFGLLYAMGHHIENVWQNLSWSCNNDIDFSKWWHHATCCAIVYMYVLDVVIMPSTSTNDNIMPHV